MSKIKVDNALGTVAADAIHVVRETVASDAFAWTPTIPGAGSYDLYARWTASSANSSAASYTVVHGNGTDVVTVNQKQDGGQWRYLGSYAFEPDAGHQVTLTAAADGAVVADAIRLVGTGPAPADVIYVHADQLGTPQKLTDATQALIWDRVQDPFGRQVSLTSSPGVANDLRFPGQLFDGETGCATRVQTYYGQLTFVRQRWLCLPATNKTPPIQWVGGVPIPGARRSKPSKVTHR
jgi:hypothetical protein